MTKVCFPLVSYYSQLFEKNNSKVILIGKLNANNNNSLYNIRREVNK